MTIKYLDAKRIRGTADPYTFTDAFTSDSAWTKVGTKWDVDTGDGRVENIAYSSYAPNDYVYHDMGSTFNAMSQSFILRFRCHHSQGSNYGYVEVGFTDSTSDADGGDMINASLNKGGGNPYLRINESIDGTMAETATGGTSASLATCYIELIFDASTRIITQKAYSDSGYSSKISAGTDPTGTFTTGEISSMTGMRYLFIGSVTASGRGLDANSLVSPLGKTFDFTSATGWVTYDNTAIGTGTVTIDTATDERVEGVSVNIAESDRVVYDLGSIISDTAWTLDVDFSCSSLTTGRAWIPCGLSSVVDMNNSTLDDNSIGMFFQNSSGTNYFRTVVYKAGAWQSETGTPTMSLNTTYYGRLQRTGDTTATSTLYPSNADRIAGTNPIGSSPDAITIPTGVTDLRYLIIGSVSTGSGSGGFIVDNVKLTANSQNIVSLPENTLFEETDTRNVYGLSSAGEWDVWYYGVGQAPYRGVFAGGDEGGNNTVMDYITIDTLGDAVTFGSSVRGNQSGGGGCGNGTYGVTGGFKSGVGDKYIDYITIATLGDMAAFGDLITSRYGCSAVDDQSRGVFAGGYDHSSYTGIIDYITIATVGNATTFGTTATTNRSGGAGNLNNNTRGLFAGGHGTGGNVIDFVTIQTTGTCSDYGDMTVGRTSSVGASSVTIGRGLIFGGNVTSTRHNIIEYMTIVTSANAVDFGDLTEAKNTLAGVSTDTRACIGGGNTGSRVTTIEYITMATLGNGTDFGDLTAARSGSIGVQGR